MKIKQVLSALEKFAPLPLQESWDNAGLQLGLTEAEVSGALLCLDVNEKIVDEAIAKGCNLIESVDGLEAGSGVVGDLPSEMGARAFVELVKNQFHVECAMCNELLERPIRKVAICGGAGDFLLPEAMGEGADAFITGEMHYHQYFGHEQQIRQKSSVTSFSASARAFVRK